MRCFICSREMLRHGDKLVCNGREPTAPMTPTDFYKHAAEQLAKELTGVECTVKLVKLNLLPEKPLTTTPTPSKSQTPPERQ